MDQINRKDESGTIPSRSDRFYLLENLWFFATREGAAMGPFETHQEAAVGLKDFLDFLNLAEPKIKKKFVEAMEH